MSSRPLGTVTFLFTDIEGSTRLWELYPEAMRAALARHDAILRAVVEAHAGYIVKTTGDGVHAAFETAAEALRAALEAQRAIFAEPWTRSPGSEGGGRPVAALPEPLRVRMGLHTGATEERGGDYFGTATNRAARLMSAAHGGQVLISLPTYELVRDGLPADVSLRDLGDCWLKDLVRPERVFQLVVPDLPAAFPPLNTEDAHPNNLPSQLTSFIGRDRAMADIEALLASNRLVTLIGPGGTGKTRLALQVGADQLHTYHDGVWLIELAPLADPALVPQTMASAIGVREEPGRPILATLIDYLRPKQTLLLLDNCEHLIDAAARLAEAVLRACPTTHILATSREALGIPGETTWQTPSLALPDPTSLALEGEELVTALSATEAVRLFVERAAAAQPGFALTSTNARVIAEICRRLDGLPLAIELAAARIRVFSVEQIATHLDDRFRLLTGGSRTALPRQQTLRALVDWSFNLLSEPERVLLRRLAAFAGGWAFDAAERVCADERLAVYDVLDGLAQLVNKSLVIGADPTMDVETARYTMLETIRAYAIEKLQQAGEDSVIRDRHLDYFLGLAEAAETGLRGPRQLRWMRRLEREQDNLRAALDWAAESGRVIDGLRLAAALYFFWFARATWSEGRQRLKSFLGRHAAAEPSAIRAKALLVTGLLGVWLGEPEEAQTLIGESLVIANEVGAGDFVALGMGLAAVGAADLDRETRHTLAAQGVAAARENGDRWTIAQALQMYGLLLNADADPQAHGVLDESLNLFREMGDRWGTADPLVHFGYMRLREGDYAGARSAFDAALVIYQEIGDQLHAAWAQIGLGHVAREEGDVAAARGWYEASLRISRRLGSKSFIANAVEGLGHIARQAGDAVQAAALYQEDVALHRERNAPADIAGALHHLAIATLVQGNARRATELATESLDLWLRTGTSMNITSALYLQGAVAAASGEWVQAARWLGAAEAAAESLAAAATTLDRADLAHYVAEVQAHLADDAVAQAWANGRGLSPEEAGREALAIAVSAG